MTITKHDPTTRGAVSPRLRHVDPNPLRDIHKGIRAALFAVTSAAGRVDPADDFEVAALNSEIADVAKLLADHAHHEDEHFVPSTLPADLGERMEREHELLDARVAWLIELAGEAQGATLGDRRTAIHELYIELASFTGAYLAHQDFEERILVPALFDRIGADEIRAIHSRVIAGMLPEQFTRGAVAMFPALNIEDRFEMLAGMRAGMPDNAFAGVWSLAASVLAPQDTADVAARLGLDASPHGRTSR
jgi:hypothetical protein